MFNTGDKLVQPSRGTVTQAYDYLLSRGATQKLTFAKEYLNELYRLCQKYTFDFGIAFGQFCDETDCGKSAYWLNNGNPAGLAITGPGVTSMTWTSGQDAARGQIVHWYVYVHGAIPQNDELAQYIHLDPHYQEALQAYGGSASTIQDFAGHWAENTNYANQIVAHANNAFPNASPSIGDTMNQPNIIDKWLHVSQDGYEGVERRYIGRFGMSPKIIVLHIQEGSQLGSWQWFHNVTASATVEIAKNGDIWRLVPEEDAPWTNGDVQSPTALGWEVINQWGADPNVYTLSIETEGMTGEWPKDQRQLDSVVWQIATWMKQYDIPLHYVLRHADINMVSRPDCPGNAFYNYVIDRLSQGVNVDATPQYSKPIPVVVDGKNWDGTKDVMVGNATFHADIQTVHAASAGVIVRRSATTRASQTRAPLKDNEGFGVLGWVNGEEVKGDRRWWITKSYSRIHVSGTKEKPKAVESAETKDGERAFGVIIYDGVAYYPALQEGKPRDLVVVTAKANLRESASTDAKAIGTVKKDDKLVAAYWCFGPKPEGHDESVWWILTTDGDGNVVDNPIEKGARLWIEATNSRPD